MILALETSGDLCSIAVSNSQGLLVERAFRHRMHLSERLIGDVDALLKDAGVTLAELDCLAVDIGPGSFTGVRLGVMTVKTWADVTGKPVIGVNALEALAEETAGIWPGITVSVVRARPGAVYACAFRPEREDMIPLNPPEMMTVVKLASLSASLLEPNLLFLGDGIARNREEIESALLDARITPVFGGAESPRAGIVAAIGARRFAAGLLDDPLSLAPLYISPPPIDPGVEARTAANLRPESYPPSGPLPNREGE